MHETGIAERIIEVALERARAAGATRVTDLNLELGPEAGFSAESVVFHLQEASASTIIDGARVNFLPTSDPHALRLVSIDVEKLPGPRPEPAEGDGPARCRFRGRWRATVSCGPFPSPQEPT